MPDELPLLLIASAQPGNHTFVPANVAGLSADESKTLKPYKFNFKDEPSVTVDGFFAHEVTAVPQAVHGEKDAIDDNGDPKYQTIDDSKLVPLLTAALQEGITEIETLKDKVAALEG